VQFTSDVHFTDNEENLGECFGHLFGNFMLSIFLFYFESRTRHSKLYSKIVIFYFIVVFCGHDYEGRIDKRHH
jgi:hypothetical protein